MTSHTLYMTSHTWQRKRFICHLTYSIWHYIHCICVIKPSVGVIPHPLSLWHHTHFMYDITFCMHDNPWIFMTSQSYRDDITASIYMTSYPIYMIWHRLLSWPQNDYTSHFTHSTWHHRHCICVVTPLYWWHHNNYGSHPPWHMYVIIHTLYDITFTLYDINSQYLWHHNRCIHDIRSPIYDITSTMYDISSPVPGTSQPLYL